MGGYERCAADYQTRIKALNAQTSQEEEQGSYYDDSLYAYEYEYAEGGDYVEDVPEDQQLNQLERKRKRRSANHPTSQHQLKRRQSEDYTTQGDSEENVKLLCCSFQKYLHCSESVVNTTCGYETAQFTKSFLDRMSGPLIQGHCQAYEYGSNGCISNGPWDEYNQYGAEPYNTGHQNVAMTWPLTLLYVLCAKLL